MWYCARIIIVVNGINYSIGTFVNIFACSPREAFWNPLIKDSRCINNEIRILFTRGYNVISDIIILILPLRAVWKLWIPTRKKIEIVFLFAIGLLYVGKTQRLIFNTGVNTFKCNRACIANGMMIVYTTRVQKKNADISYLLLWLGLWASAEISFGIIVTCVFTLPKFIKAKGAKIQDICSSPTRHSMSFMSGSFGHLMQSNKNTSASQGMTFNGVETSDHSAGDLSFANRDQDLESYPSQEDTYDVNKYSSVTAADPSHKV